MSSGKRLRPYLLHLVAGDNADRDAVLVFYAWTAVVSIGVLLMYIGTTQDWPGDYLFGVGYVLLGIAACLVVTLLPTPRTPAAPVAAPEPRTP